MKTWLLIVALALVATAASCTGRITGKFPNYKESPNHVKVVVVREFTFISGGVKARLHVNGIIIAHLYAGDHAVFSVKPGETSVGILGANSLEFDARKGQTYYFKILVDASQWWSSSNPFEFEKIDSTRAEEIMKNTTNISKKDLSKE